MTWPLDQFHKLGYTAGWPLEWHGTWASIMPFPLRASNTRTRQIRKYVADSSGVATSGTSKYYQYLVFFALEDLDFLTLLLYHRAISLYTGRMPAFTEVPEDAAIEFSKCI